MLELISQFSNEAILAASIAITGWIKDKGYLAKVDTRLISVVVTAILIAFTHYVVIPDAAITIFESFALLVLPSFGYDYFVNPIVKPIFELFKKKS
jgi:hypothetical protein